MKINENLCPQIKSEQMAEKQVFEEIEIDENHLHEKPNWYKYKNELHYFKYRQDTRLITELIANRFGEAQGLNMASYFPALLNGKVGLLSPNFQKPGADYIDMYTLYSAELYGRRLNAAEFYSFTNILEKYKYLLGEDSANYKSLIKELVDLYIFDWFIHHRDRNPLNLTYEGIKDKITLAPIFDSEASFGQSKKEGFKNVSTSTWQPSMPYELGMEPGKTEGLDDNMIGIVSDYPEFAIPQLQKLDNPIYYQIIKDFQRPDYPISLEENEAQLLNELIDARQEEAYKLTRI